MTDIVERLRLLMRNSEFPLSQTAADAIAEIESLRIEASAYRSGMDINAEKTKKTPSIDWAQP